MANKRSSKKDLRRTARRLARNQGVQSSLKTLTRKVREAPSENKGAALRAAISALDRAAERGIIHKNQAARRKSRAARAAAAPIASAPARTIPQETELDTAAKGKKGKKS
jgi:small subunit ribosomal protein S20